MKLINRILFILVAIILMHSCIPFEKLKYVQPDKDETQTKFINKGIDKTIQPRDELYINVFSIDEQTKQIFDSRVQGGGEATISLLSYTVDSDGYINFPFIGRFFVQDLTLIEAQEKLEDTLKQYLTDVTIILRYVGNSITLLGEVNRPGSYPYYDSKINIFEAISSAGGVAPYGNKEEVVIIREIDDEISYHEIDLSRRDVVQSEYYFLLPNDIVIIEPTRAKYRSYRDYSLVSILLSSVATLATVFAIIRNMN